jgi:heat shock protein HtpX
VHAHRNGLKTALLLGLLSGLILFFGARRRAPAVCSIALVVALGVNGYSYFYSDKLALRSMRAYPISQVQHPRLYAIVAELASSMRMPMPRLYLSPTRRPNAFATGRNPQNAAVCCTEGILQLLDERELRGVLGHELAHVGNRDILISSVAAALATVITFLANMAQFAMIFGGGAARAGTSVQPAADHPRPDRAGVIQMAISRNREYAADLTGAQVTGDPLALASALRKLERGTAARPLVEDPSLAPDQLADDREPLPGRRHRQAVQHPPADGRADRPARVDGRLPALTPGSLRCPAAQPTGRNRFGPAPLRRAPRALRTRGIGLPQARRPAARKPGARAARKPGAGCRNPGFRRSTVISDGPRRSATRTGVRDPQALRSGFSPPGSRVLVTPRLQGDLWRRTERETCGGDRQRSPRPAAWLAHHR